MSMSIDGMTCAACVNAIVDALQGKEGISDLNVDLLGRSGSTIISQYEIGEQTKTIIDDIGYECEIVTIDQGSIKHAQRFGCII